MFPGRKFKLTTSKDDCWCPRLVYLQISTRERMWETVLNSFYDMNKWNRGRGECTLHERPTYIAKKGCMDLKRVRNRFPIRLYDLCHVHHKYVFSCDVMKQWEPDLAHSQVKLLKQCYNTMEVRRLRIPREKSVTQPE